jgi:hypothetical protein
MGFVAKSVFWLGLVYSAMPFESGAITAPAPTATGTPLAVGSSLESFASAVIPHNQDGWKSAVQAAATLCAPNCLRPTPAGLIGAPAGKDPTDPPSRRVSREKSGREGAVRPAAANHIRSPDRQT